MQNNAWPEEALLYKIRRPSLSPAERQLSRAVNAMRVAENARFEALGRYHEALRKWQEAGS